MILVLSIGISGCGGGGAAKNTKGQTKPRVSAAGKVQYDGKPLAAGLIGFTSTVTGNSASCEIKDGAFACTAEAGPNPGDNTVLITGKDSATGPAVWVWTTKVEVPDAGLTAGDFSVDPKKTKPAPKPNPDD